MSSSSSTTTWSLRRVPPRSPAAPHRGREGLRHGCRARPRRPRRAACRTIHGLEVRPVPREARPSRSTCSPCVTSTPATPRSAGTCCSTSARSTRLHCVRQRGPRALAPAPSGERAPALRPRRSRVSALRERPRRRLRATRSRKARRRSCSRARIRRVRRAAARELPGALPAWRALRASLLRVTRAYGRASPTRVLKVARVLEHTGSRGGRASTSSLLDYFYWLGVSPSSATSPQRAHSRNLPRIFAMARSVYYFTDSDESGGAEAALLLADREPRPERVAADPALQPRPAAGTGRRDAPASSERPFGPCPASPLGLAGARRVRGIRAALRRERPAVFHAHLSLAARREDSSSPRRSSRACRRSSQPSICFRPSPLGPGGATREDGCSARASDAGIAVSQAIANVSRGRARAGRRASSR